MIAKKKKQPNQKSKTSAVRGFLPDFSKYLFKDYPIDDAYQNKDLITKLKNLVSELLITQNPAQDLQNNGLCKKLELMKPGIDKKFMDKCDFPEGKIYYAAYGKNAYRIVFGIDTNQRIAYFFALDNCHSVRKV
ncbi:hypothetical protein IJN73_00225 [Candidatus Saccharibacteria bacterium]|nr:hypothetical protein [Candidatus Saccharibacteria bacterium]